MIKRGYVIEHKLFGLFFTHFKSRKYIAGRTQKHCPYKVKAEADFVTIKLLTMKIDYLDWFYVSWDDCKTKHELKNENIIKNRAAIPARVLL